MQYVNISLDYIYYLWYNYIKIEIIMFCGVYFSVEALDG